MATQVIRDEAAVSELVQGAVNQYGKLDLLVRGAGIFKMQPLENIRWELWDETLSAQTRGQRSDQIK